MFQRLLTLLDEQGKLTVHRICTGFREGQLQKAFNKLADEKSVGVRVWALSSIVKKRKISDVFQLVESLDENEAVMLHMDTHDHWILAHSGTGKQFWVDDSSDETAPLRIRAGQASKYEINISDGLVFLNAQTH